MGNSVSVKDCDFANIQRRITRQIAFLKSYRNAGFNIAAACLAVGISRKTFNAWYSNASGMGEGHVVTDPDGETEPVTFQELFDEVKDEVDDFIEGKLLERIRRGDTLAVIFGAKTRLKHRGYMEHMKIDNTLIPAMPKEQADAVILAYEESKKFKSTINRDRITGKPPTQITAPFEVVKPKQLTESKESVTDAGE